MKKLLCVFLALLAAVCLLSMTVSAESAPVLSEDLQTLTVGNKTYSQADLSAMNLFYGYELGSVQLPNNLQNQIKNTVVHCTENEWVISVELYYYNGARMELCFVEDSVLPEVLEICQGDEVVCYVDFWWENRPSVSAPIAQFKDEPTTLNMVSPGNFSYYEVIHFHEELDTYVYRGFLYAYRDTYYYVDYQENNICNPVGFYPSAGPDLYKAYKITDPELLEQIMSGIESEYSGTTQLGQILSSIFLTFVFAVIPAAILVLSIILFLKTKAYYRLTWGITGGLCIAELIVFMILYLFLS